jgi:hypothetical protein
MVCFPFTMRDRDILTKYYWYRRFPKARVWPPLPSGSTALNGDDEYACRLPEPAMQDHLLDLYFTYVHPSIPVVHKRAFFEAYKTGYVFISGAPRPLIAFPTGMVRWTLLIRPNQTHPPQAPHSTGAGAVFLLSSYLPCMPSRLATLKMLALPSQRTPR